MDLPTVSSDSSNSPLHLLNMPWLITDYIMRKMERSDLMNLRLTCKTTKSWAERREYFQSMRIHIKSKQSFQFLLKRSQTQTPTRWNSFVFHWVPSSSKSSKSKTPPTNSKISKNPKPNLILEFSQIFGDHIHTLEFTSYSKKVEAVSSGIIEILLGCPNLKILIIRVIDSLTIRRLSLSQKIQMSKVLRNLQQLGIFELYCHDESDATVFINLFLSKCTNSLRYVSVPVLIYPRLSSLYVKYGAKEPNSLNNNTNPTGTLCAPTDVFVVRPMIQLLECEAPNLQTISVVPESRGLLSDSALFCLSILCYHKRIHLVYGAMSWLPLDLGCLNYSLSCHPTMSEIASKIMTVMASTTDLLLNNEFANLRKLFVRFRSFHVEKDIFVVQHFPKLKLLHVDFEIEGDLNNLDVKLRRMDMFIQGLFDRPRPTVQRIDLYNHSQVEKSIQLNMEKLVSSFCNLKEISLINYNGNTEDFTKLWAGLKLLEKIEAKKCPGLCDKGILGKNWIKPLILDLKYLREITFVETGRITDLSYIIAFRHMRLRKFHHEPLFPSDVTTAGYNSLAEGDIHRFVRFLDCGTRFFACKNRTELKQYLEMFDALIEPQVEVITKYFTKHKLYHRLVRKLSMEKECWPTTY